MTVLVFLTALLAGIANPFQSGLNAELNKQLGKPIWAALFIYISALAALLLFQAFARQPFPTDKIASVPWWAWLGGLVSILSTVIALTLAQRMGSGIFTGATLTASVITSVLLDHFGLIGFKQHTAGPGRITGCALLIAGLWLIARF